MPINKGKVWEKCFQESWEQSFPSSLLIRLPDQQSGYLGTSRNICDFIGFKSPDLFLIECKSTKGNTLPLSNLKQYERLLPYSEIEHVRVGFAVWWSERGVTAWIPISAITELKAEGKKSVHVRYVEGGDYGMVKVPNIIKRVYPKCDFRCLIEEDEV